MKMYALYNVANISNLEYNHRKYCDSNNIEYNKIYISDSLSEKYSYILKCLQKNLNNTLMFIDNFTFFKKFNYIPSLTNDIYIQKYEKTLIDNFFIVKSTEKTIKIFEQALHSINKVGFFVANWHEIREKKIDFLEEFCTKYPHQADNGTYINICLSKHNNSYDLTNVLCANFMHTYAENEGKYFADAVCAFSGKIYELSQEKYECFNPGYPTAFVTLYTPNIADAGIVAEKNLKQFCLTNKITLHVYRDVPEELSKQNISGAWGKPWLLLKHFDDYEDLIWIDSDILIAKNYKIDLSYEIAVYKDPNAKFNSGYMIFKTTPKNKQLLKTVIEKIQKIDGVLEGVYKHGGDQPRFIEAVFEYYPDYSPLSALLGNTHPVFPISVSPYQDDVMLHFMGFDKNLRITIMRSYNEIMLKQYNK